MVKANLVGNLFLEESVRNTHSELLSSCDIELFLVKVGKHLGLSPTQLYMYMYLILVCS